MWFRSRGWLNLGFWLVWCSSLGWVLNHARGSELQGQISLFLAGAALWLNVFPRFLQGPKLSGVFSQIAMLRLPLGSRESMVVDIALDDLLSDKPSPQAQRLMERVPAIAYAVNAKQREELAKLFRHTHPTRYDYLPCDETITPHLWDPRATPAFFIPIVVHNAGGALANISSIIMIMRVVGVDHRRWAYAAYLEVDPKVIIDPRRPVKDVDIFSSCFPGCAVRPSESVRLDLHFTPHHNTGCIQSNLIPGDYEVSIIGFDAQGRLMFRTKAIRYPVRPDSLLESFKGGQWTYYVNVEECVADALR